MLTAAAAGDAYGALQGITLQAASPGVLANDASTTGNPLSVIAFTQPTHGTLALNPDGSFGYTAASTYSGADSFTYTATDGSGTSTATVSLEVTACTPTACVFAGPRLASVDSTQGPLLNAVLGGLLGTSLDLTAVDWTGLANSSISGSALIQDLQVDLGLSGPAQVLAANITATQLITAASEVAAAGGDTAQIAALGDLLAQVGPATGTIQLGGLLQGTLDDGDLADVDLNTLDLVTGAVQLYNFDNVATTPTPITISGAELAALGLPASVGSLNLYAQVVEPPIFTCGPAGTQFHTAAIRLELDLNNMVGLNLDTSAILTSISGALGIAPGLLNVSASVDDLKVYVEVASASGTIESIDAISQAVTLQATPSIADVYVGNIDPAVFFDRTHVIDPATDLTFGDVANLSITTLGVPVASAPIAIRDVALGVAPGDPTTLTFNPPYPAPAQTVGSSAVAAANLSTELATNLQVEVDGSLGVLLDPILGTIQTGLVAPLVNGVLTPILDPILGGVVDPLLSSLGVGIGEAIVDVDGVGMMCPAIANADFDTTPLGTPAVVPVLDNDASPPDSTTTITATTPPAHGTIVANPDGTITYTPAAGFVGTDTFTYTISDGFGTPSTAVVTVITAAAVPTAVDDAYTTVSGTTLVVIAPGVRANDTDPGGQILAATAVTQPAHGTLALSADGSFSYIPAPGFVGTDTFTYDDAGDGITSNVATVTIAVTAPLVVPSPTAAADAYITASGTTLVVAAPGVRGNDTNPGGVALAATVVAQPGHGTLALNSDGSFTYIPAAGFVGTDVFTYEDAGEGVASNVATVILLVTPGGVTPAARSPWTTPTPRPQARPSPSRRRAS